MTDNHPEINGQFKTSFYDSPFTVIILLIVYFGVLGGIYSAIVSAENKHIQYSISVAASDWLSLTENNEAMVRVSDLDYKDREFNSNSIFIGWYKDNQPQEYNNVELPSWGFDVLRMPELKERNERLKVELLNTRKLMTWQLTQRDEEFIEKNRLSTANQFDSYQFSFDDMSEYQTSRFWFGEYLPGSELGVYPLSEFAPDRPNEVLFVDIHDGVPYEGEIKVELQNAPPDAKPMIVQADLSGVTSLFFKVNQKTDFKITAGDDVLNVSFAPKPKSFHIDISENRIMALTSEKPKVRITQVGQRTGIYIDYFIGYAWFCRQFIRASEIGDIVELDPVYQKYNNLNYSKIIYARFSTSEDPQNNDDTQTIAMIMSSEIRHPDRTLPERREAVLNEEFSAIYQDYIKIHELNQAEEAQTYRNYTYSAFNKIIKHAELQEKYEIFLVASIIKPLLTVKYKDGSEDPRTIAARVQLRKYLMNRLAAQHHPHIHEIANSLETEKIALEAQKSSAQRKYYIFAIIWLCVGIISFGAAAHRIRVRRQAEWFDEAAKGNKKNDALPGSPLILKVGIAALIVGLISSVFMWISLL